SGPTDPPFTLPEPYPFKEQVIIDVMFPGQCGNTAFFFKSQPDQFHFEFRGIVFPGKSFFSAHEVSTCKISGCLSYRILDSGPDGTQTTLTPELDYDRWMMELDPKERNRRHHFGEPETVAFPAANKPVNADHALHTTGSDESEGVPLPVSSSRPEVSGGAVTPVPGNASSPSETPINEPPRHEVQPDMYGAAPVISGESGDVSGLVTLSDGYGEENGGEEDNGEDGLLSLLTPEPEVVLQDDAPVSNDSIWHVPAHQDDIEHLQNTAFRLAWELGEVLGCEDEILPQRDKDTSAGYVGAGEVCSEAAAFLLGLTGEAPVLHPAAGVCGLPELFTGGPGEGEAPALTDEDALKLLRLMRVMRRLRELQRGLKYGEDNSDE
ncbi:hypothetical protein AF41_00388, partial [Citrobacter sp. MGH 55]